VLGAIATCMYVGCLTEGAAGGYLSFYLGWRHGRPQPAGCGDFGRELSSEARMNM
jgi:hypothetical protein